LTEKNKNISRRVLIIEDNDTMREGMMQVAKKMGLDPAGAGDGPTALQETTRRSYPLVITDYRLPGMDGLEILKRLKEISPAAEVMMITAHGSIELAVEAMRAGAADFITKPFSHEEFKLRIQKILKKIDQEEKLNRLDAENDYLRGELEQQFNFGDIIGESPRMKELYRTIAKVARTDSSVIIYGESGTGKEMVARAIHKTSERSANPFIRVNCGALAEGVLESELFGHEKGAFTGALRRKHGRFELAHTGTIFLDEIGDIPLGTQVKLLRVLQEREFERVGGEQTLTVDVRVVAATHRDLKALVSEGRFREDLFYRLDIIPISLPPLRERPEDIPLLADHFLSRIGHSIGRVQMQLTAAAMDSLCCYWWPGNVRELENLLERAAVLADGDTIRSEDLPISGAIPPAIGPAAANGNLDHLLDQVEKTAIEKALAEAHGVKAKAARILGVKTSALYYKMEKYGLM